MPLQLTLIPSSIHSDKDTRKFPFLSKTSNFSLHIKHKPLPLLCHIKREMNDQSRALHAHCSPTSARAWLRARLWTIATAAKCSTRADHPGSSAGTPGRAGGSWRAARRSAESPRCRARSQAPSALAPNIKHRQYHSELSKGFQMTYHGI